MTRRELLRLAMVGPILEAAACHRSKKAARAAAPAGPRFREVAAASGLGFHHSFGPRTHALPEDMGSGLAWGDYDNDGYPDLYVVNQPGAWGSTQRHGPGNRLFHNQRDGTFRDVTAAAGLELVHFGMGAAWGDCNNDGLLDLCVTGADGLHLYRNLGNGRFRDVTRAAGLNHPGWCTSALWFDFDNDGWLDLYVCRYVRYPSNLSAFRFSGVSRQYGLEVPPQLNPQSFTAEPNLLFRNNRDGTFTEIAHRAGVADAHGRSLVVTAADFHRDGRLDLYVGNDLSMNRFFYNRGDGRFLDRSAQTWTAENKGTMGFAVADYNQDGELDFFVAHWLGEGDSLYQNLGRVSGQLAFTDVAADVRLAYVTLPVVGWGCGWLDYDNDGVLDLVVANGNTLETPEHPDLLQPEKSFLFHGVGQAFTNVAAAVAPALAVPRVARGLALADYDRDGDLDVAILCNRGPLLLLRADGAESRNWLQLHLVGRRGHPSAIGARVRLHAGGKVFFQQVGAQGSYLSQHDLPLHFGLGEEKPERLEIAWPSGRRQTIAHPQVRQLLRIVED